MKLTRRSAMGMLAGASLALSQTPRLPFGFSLYGMKTLPWREGLAQVARIGYQCTELCLRAGWDTEPKLLTKADRAEVRKRTGDLGLELSSVMENLGLGRSGGSRDANLERLRAAAEVCHECSPGRPALIETTVGGRPEAWEDMKNAMADELAAWVKKADELKTTLAIKAHSKTAMNRPERLLWLASQVQSSSLKFVYDYSHFAAFGLDMEKQWNKLCHARFSCTSRTPSAARPITGSCCLEMGRSTSSHTCEICWN